MKASSLKRYLKSKAATHPGTIRLIKKASRIVSGNRGPSHPATLGKEVAAVTEVLRGPFWNLNYGRDLVHEKLEEEFAAYIGTRYAVAVNTGGMAIQMALRAFG